MSITEDLEREIERAKKIIANCEASSTLSFAAIWLRALVLRSQKAIRDRDIVAMIACMKQIREVKGS
jgi:hypothetical protein